MAGCSPPILKCILAPFFGLFDPVPENARQGHGPSLPYSIAPHSVSVPTLSGHLAFSREFSFGRDKEPTYAMRFSAPLGEDSRSISPLRHFSRSSSRHRDPSNSSLVLLPPLPPQPLSSNSLELDGLCPQLLQRRELTPAFEPLVDSDRAGPRVLELWQLYEGFDGDEPFFFIIFF